MNIFSRYAILELAQIEQKIRDIVFHYEDKTLTLRDLCYTPVPSKGCIVQSVTGYYQNNASVIERMSDDKVIAHLKACVYVVVKFYLIF